MRKAFWLSALLAALPLAALAQSAEAEAGDVSEVDKDRVGPLRERVRPVSGNVFLKKGRFELTPGVTLSAKDAFYSKYIPGAALTYHFMENAALSARFGYSIPLVSGAAQICETDNLGLRTCTLPTTGQLDRRAPGKMLMVGGVDAQWAPIYGKISLVSESFLHFDMFGLLGASFVQYLGPQGETATGGLDLGVGMRFFANRWMAARLEIRDLLYFEDKSPGGSLRNQLLVHFGFSLFFPITFREG
ncbi:MAG: outer membrane beta-barrel domain-containing protein [Myxococcales bacterium]|nr:outer membrane beta-barrel domain-containing protein [Myxococcales bacterium]